MTALTIFKKMWNRSHLETLGVRCPMQKMLAKVNFKYCLNLLFKFNSVDLILNCFSLMGFTALTEEPQRADTAYNNACDLQSFSARD